MEKTIIIHKNPEQGLYFSKPEGYPQPINEVEAKSMIIDDISTTTEGLMTLVQMANDSGYMDADKAAKMIIKYFTDAYISEPEKEK